MTNDERQHSLSLTVVESSTPQPRAAIVVKFLLVLAIGVTLNFIPFRLGPGQTVTGLPLPFRAFEATSGDRLPASLDLASFMTLAVNAGVWCWMARLIASQRLWTYRATDRVKAARCMRREILLLAVLLLLAGTFLPIWMRHPDFGGITHGHSAWTEPHEH